MIKSKTWATSYMIAVVLILIITGLAVYAKDPWFHYHKPDTSKYYYKLTIPQERAQNNGILRNFDYEGIITGSSMCANFNASEAEALFGCTFVKSQYSGATFYEINNSIRSAISYNDSVKIVIRGLDEGKFMEDPEGLRDDLGEYPEYLYDNVLYNDVKYLYNRDLLFDELYYSVYLWPKDRRGITSFDEYGKWMNMSEEFGVNALYPDGIPATESGVEQVGLTEEEKALILANTRQNVTQLAAENPQITFYYFFTPYSGAWYYNQVNSGKFEKHVETLKLVTEEMLKYDNIKLFAFYSLTDMINDLNNYKDTCHYADWVNSMILEFMHDEKCLLTRDNYNDYFEKMKDFYGSFDYEGTFSTQIDYEDNLDAKNAFKGELTARW